jgi:cyclic 2,3-diphosphoglycerate synthetase
MKASAVALIDGEHYPSVVVDAMRQSTDRFDYLGAVFLGGLEKIREEGFEAVAEKTYGLPVVFDEDPFRGLSRAIELFHPEVVVDLSDEPVLGYRQRLRLVSYSLARNVGYVGPDFHFSPAGSDHLCLSPSLSIIGTGKRVGKTAVSGYVARMLRDLGEREEAPSVVVIAMGRGGPAEPEVIDGAAAGPDAKRLLAWSREGRHAASDYLEDAALSRVVTVGCRRCGGGMAGEPFVSNVAAGARLANSLHPGFVIFEGSGAAVPPVATDARLLVAGAQQPMEDITGYLGMYRVLTSDALVLTMAEQPLASEEKVRTIINEVQELNPNLSTVPVVFRPRPVQPVEGKRVAFFSTAPATQQKLLTSYLEERYGCRVKLFSGNLSSRPALRADLEKLQTTRIDTVLTEIKAAAIEVVAQEAEDRELELVFVDNVPLEAEPAQAGRLAELTEELVCLARERFEARA